MGEMPIKYRGRSKFFFLCIMRFEILCLEIVMVETNCSDSIENSNTTIRCISELKANLTFHH